MYRVSPSEADKWVFEAEKKMSLNTGFLKFFFGGPKKIDDAIECYKRAGNLYKMDKKWDDAGGCFLKSASLSLGQKNKHQAALDYEQAAVCFRKVDPEEAEKCFLKSIEIYLDLGRFTMAAKVHETIGTMYEGDAAQTEKATQHFEQASEYYKGEESSSASNRCLLKVAQRSAEAERYEKAIEIYEDVATSSLESSLLKYGAKEYFFRATICRLCLDVEDAKINLRKYAELSPSFADTREYKFCYKLIRAVEEQNAEELTDVVKEFDSIQFLDKWFTSLLLRIKRKINAAPDLR